MRPTDLAAASRRGDLGRGTMRDPARMDGLYKMSMTQTAQYLESKVLTAPPQRLHLMLIEGAQRFGRQAEEALRRGDAEAAAAPMLRVLDIVGELLAVVRAKKSELNSRIADFYWFLFRRVSLAKIHGDAAMLSEVLRLLDYERQTWQLVCDKLEAASAPAAATATFHAHLQRASQAGFTLEA
jgi:flagellar protein FliS